MEPIDLAAARDGRDWALLEQTIRTVMARAMPDLDAAGLNAVCAALRKVHHAGALRGGMIEVPQAAKPAVDQVVKFMHATNDMLFSELAFAYAQLASAGIEPMSICGLRGPALRLV